jgi:hypothetical protein
MNDALCQVRSTGDSRDAEQSLASVVTHATLFAMSIKFTLELADEGDERTKQAVRETNDRRRGRAAWLTSNCGAVLGRQCPPLSVANALPQCRIVEFTPVPTTEFGWRGGHGGVPVVPHNAATCRPTLHRPASDDIPSL